MRHPLSSIGPTLPPRTSKQCSPHPVGARWGRRPDFMFCIFSSQIFLKCSTPHSLTLFFVHRSSWKNAEQGFLSSTLSAIVGSMVGFEAVANTSLRKYDVGACILSWHFSYAFCFLSCHLFAIRRILKIGSGWISVATVAWNQLVKW